MESSDQLSEPVCSASKPEKVGDCLSIEEKKKRFQEEFCPTAGLSNSQKKRQRKLRQIRRFRDESCRQLLEKDEELEALRAENNEIREICREQIEQHQAVVQKVNDASRTGQIALVCAREVGKESSPGCAARSDRDQVEPEGFNCSSFLQNAESGQVGGQPFDESFDPRSTRP